MSRTYMNKTQNNKGDIVNARFNCSNCKLNAVADDVDYSKSFSG